MKNSIKFLYSYAFVFALAVLVSSFVKEKSFKMPYQQAGLTKQQAAAHLLSRFTYGAKPTEIDELVKIGLEKWFKEQIEGNLTDDLLNGKLANYDAINLSNTEVENKYPRGAQIVRMAIKDGFINKDSVSKIDKKEYKDIITAYMKQKGIKPQAELYRQFISQKILRAAYTSNQFKEIMTDFWFNHFNVSLSKNECAAFVPAYERDVIRPNVFGKFEDLLLATAKSPAMLMYLDNFSSMANSKEMGAAQPEMMLDNTEAKNKESAQNTTPAKPLKLGKKKQGLNENYAREVMELHTLGVDGGYTQQDVTEAARVLTGWTIAPMGNNAYGTIGKKVIDKVGKAKLKVSGVILDGDFMFAAKRHDEQAKTVLGKKFSANGGYEEGVSLLKMLANHVSTSKFIAKKIAVRFVSDEPPQSLVDKMAETFLSSNGDIKKVLITLVTAPEFWTNQALREKTKSPFELAISTVRCLDANINQPYQLYNWINKMGQQMYYYQAPTGFPDKGQYWINTGSLLNRMNFGLALATGRIPGITVNLAKLNNNHEPESAAAALLIYGEMMLPERNLEETIKRLQPLLNDPNLLNKVVIAANNNLAPQPISTIVNEDAVPKAEDFDVKKNKKNSTTMQNMGYNTMLAQVVGIVIGSPEFQRK